jgi:hypothetical protein
MRSKRPRKTAAPRTEEGSERAVREPEREPAQGHDIDSGDVPARDGDAKLGRYPDGNSLLPRGDRRDSPFSTIPRQAVPESDVARSPTRRRRFPDCCWVALPLTFRRAMSQLIVFASTCPRCKREQPQDGFTVADLLRLLDGGDPIEGYCVICDKFWPLSLQERVRLGELVVASHRDNIPPEDDDRPRLPKSD